MLGEKGIPGDTEAGRILQQELRRLGWQEQELRARRIRPTMSCCKVRELPG